METERYCFIAFGELALDVTYNQYNIINEVGGVSAFNTLYNLSVFGEETYAVGGVGTDMNAIKAINSLRSSFANTDNIQFVSKPTNVFYIYKPEEILNGENEEIPIGRESPITGKSSIEWSDKLCTTLPKQFEDRNIILIVSNFEKVTQDFIENVRKKAKNSIVSLDITNPHIFKNITKEDMWKYLKNIDLLQCNENTFKFVCEKLGISSAQELYAKLNLQIFTLTNGSKGAHFFYREDDQIKEIAKVPEKVVPIVDSTGAGDAFHAMLLMAYKRNLINNEELDKQYFDNAFKVANALSRKVVQIDGARGKQEDLLSYMLRQIEETKENKGIDLVD